MVPAAAACGADGTDPQRLDHDGLARGAAQPALPYFQTVVPAYQRSKAALNAVTIALSKLLADTLITVDSVCPGFVRTDITPANRAQAPLSAAEAGHFVADMALVDNDKATGRFVDRDGSVAW